MHKHFSILKDTTDESLLDLLRKGREDAFTEIYSRYNKRLYAIAYKYLQDTERTKDSVQNIFIKLWEGRSSRKINSNLKSYLFIMLRNHVLNELRNDLTAMLKNQEICCETDLFENDIIQNMEEQEMLNALYQAINKLPSQKKTVCMHKLKDSLSNREIANEMNISVPTVKTHYSQAIKILRKVLSKTSVFILFLQI